MAIFLGMEGDPLVVQQLEEENLIYLIIVPTTQFGIHIGEGRRDVGTQCNLCAQKCPMQLSPAAIKEQSPLPHGGDCLKCRVCVESCPKAALAFQRGSLGREAA